MKNTIKKRVISPTTYIVQATLFIVLLFTQLSANESKQERVSLQLNWKHQFEFAGYYMAKEKGFYQDVDLDVDIKEYNNTIDIVQNTLDNANTFGIGYSSLIYERANAKDIVLLAAMLQSSPNVLVSLESSHIKTIEDFKNKTVMLDRESVKNASFISMLQSHNISFDEMKRVQHTFNIQDLISGKVDLAFYYTSNELYYLDKKGLKYNVWDPKDYEFDLYSNILYTSNEFLKAHPQKVENFTRASLKGWEYAFAHIDETIQVIQTKYNTQAKTKEALRYEAEVLKKLAYANNKKLGDIDTLKVQRIYDIYNLLQLVKHKIDYDSFIYKLPSNNAFSQKEKEYLKTKKLIKLCIDPQWMPYESFDKNNNHIGMSADFFQIFQKKVGVEIRPVVSHDWDETLSFMKKGKCDILSLAMQTPKRQEYLNFTKPYIEAPLVIFTKQNIGYIGDINALKGKKIGIVKGYAFNEIYRKKYPFLNIIDLKNIDEGLNRVNAGELFACIDTPSSINYQLQVQGKYNLKISGILDDKLELGIGVRKDDTILLHIFEKVLHSMSLEQKQTIINKWASTKIEKITNFEYLKELTIVFMLFIVLSIYWMRQLAKANKKVKESSDKFEYLFNNTMEGIILFQENVVVDINESGLKIFGTNDKTKLLGKLAIEFIALDSQDIVKINMKLFHAEPYEVNLKRYDGSIYPALVQGIYTNLNGINTRITTVVDLSELKEKEKALQIAKEKAEESTKLKSEFLANMSHEIRTPMNGIIGMTYLALESNPNKKQSKYLHTINNSANSLLNIINDILDFSKIEAGKLQIDTIDFNLSELLANISNIVGFKAKEKGLDFHIVYDKNSNLNLHGDSLRISQILINLINNAIKFTDKGFVQVEVVAVESDYSFIISDSGIGISKAKQEKLFSAFHQVDGTTTRKYGGSGLGLSISKQLVELMHGKIWLESKENVGSTFTFVLHLPEAKKPIQIKQKIDLNEIQKLKSSKILLVEDNTVNQEIVLGVLDNSGIEVDIANNGKEGIEKFHQNQYELILMDIQMPIMDGYEATKIIREVDKAIPIIALTANAMKEDVEKTQAMGMNEHINKPIDIEKLYEIFLKYISAKTQILTINDDTQTCNLEIPNFAYINTQRGLQHLAGNKKLYFKLLHDFYTTYKDIDLALYDDEEYKRTLHTLKGLSANIGATSLHNVVKELEKHNDMELQEQFYVALKKVMQELQTLPHNNQTHQEKKNITKIKRDELFLELKKLLKVNRPIKIEAIMNEITLYKFSDDDEIFISKIKDLISGYKFKEARELMNEN